MYRTLPSGWLTLRPALHISNQDAIKNRCPLGTRRYNVSMTIAIFAMRVLEVMFFVGLSGSAVVVLISFFEDAKELMEKD